MFACLDVAYGPDDTFAVAAAVVFDAWDAATPRRELTARHEPVAPYEPGAFYRRELPPLLAVLERVAEPLETIVVDGYVWLSAGGRPGLGAHLYQALGGAVVVVGVAKRSFHGDAPAAALTRGESARPLWVTAAGASAEEAAGWIRRMDGAHRIPTLLRRVDGLCRAGASD